MNKTTLNSQKEKHSLLSLRRATAGSLYPGTVGREFLSTLSLRRATAQSIRSSCQRRHFYPRSPCGERPLITFPKRNRPIFLSTLSLRRATNIQDFNFGHMKFLSTLSLRRATWQSARRGLAPGDFYPRSPCGERRAGRGIDWNRKGISIHALLAESDQNLEVIYDAIVVISIHALLAESDPAR